MKSVLNKTFNSLVNNPIVNNFGAILLIVILLLLLQCAYNRYLKTEMLKVKEYFQSPENYFIMDETKDNYFYFTTEIEESIHSSSELSYRLNNTNYSILPYTLPIDFTTITSITLPNIRHLNNTTHNITLEKASGSSYNDTLFYIKAKITSSGSSGSSSDKYIGDTTSGNFAGVFKIDTKTEAKKFRLVRQDEAQTAIRRFNPFIGKPMLKIHPKNNQVELSFEINPSQASKVDNFLIVLGKYDKDKNNIGHLKVHTSQESNEGQDICNVEMGRRKCKHMLSDIDHIDANGDVLYYRISVIAISTGNVISNYMEPVYPGGYTHFVMTKTFKDMEDLVERARNESLSEEQRDRINSQLISEAGGEYEFIKKQLGGFPDNLILDINKNTLSDVVDQSMSLGEINMIVS